MPVAAVAQTGPSVSAEPTVIEKLWVQAKAYRREYHIQNRLCDRLEKIVEQRMPEPHPSIIWGGPNEADGLVYWVKDREPPYFKRYIFSGWLKGKLEAASEPKFTKITGSKNGREEICTIIERSKEDGPFPFTEEQLALRDRLAARLELSRRYERKLKRMKRQIGLAAAERNRDNACDRQVKLNNKILDVPTMSRRDLAIKLAIYKDYQEDIGAEEILRDVERLVREPEFLSNLAA
ncbi:MAG: hypothetical protein WCB70_11490 [Xanthobacteraceae bacterium]